MSDNIGFERWVVLLAGGIGSRFWPASTPGRPKQLLPLAGEQPLIVETLQRARALAPAANLLIVAGEHLRPQLKEALPDLRADQLLVEPEAKGTAPALAWAAREVIARATRPEDTVMVSLHSDHAIRPLERFVSTLEQAMEGAALTDRLVTIGIEPTRPETGYGYIEVGDPLQADVLEVQRFVEKPDRATAEEYLRGGGYLWNSGMFVWRPQVLLAEFVSHTPEIARALPRLEAEDVAGFFNTAPNLTIDHGLMERTRNIAVLRGEFEWDDVGAWAALLRVRQVNQEGNLLLGEAHAVDCGGSLIWAEDGPVVAFGVEGLVVVRSSGVTLVTTKDRANDLKSLLARLPDRLASGAD